MCRSIFGCSGELTIGFDPWWRCRLTRWLGGAGFDLLGGRFLSRRFLGGFLCGRLLGGGLLSCRFFGAACSLFCGALAGAFWRVYPAPWPAVLTFPRRARAALAGRCRPAEWAVWAQRRARVRVWCRVNRPVDPAGLPCGCSFAVSRRVHRPCPPAVESIMPGSPGGQSGDDAARAAAGGQSGLSGQPTAGLSGPIPHLPYHRAAHEHHRADNERPDRDVAGRVSEESAAGPGVPVPVAVSRNDHEPDTTCPSADVTR